MLYKFGRHAVAVVGHGDVEFGPTRRVAGQFSKAQLYTAAVGRILHRIGEQVYEHLPQPHAVAYQHFMRYFVYADCERLAALLRICADYAVHLSHLLGHVYGFPVQLNLAGLYAAHVQYVVYQPQQVTAGRLHLADI